MSWTLDDVQKKESENFTADELEAKLAERGVKTGKFVISNAEQVEFDKKGGGKQRKVKLSFSNSSKSLIIGVTVQNHLAELIGTKVPLDWIGYTIELTVKPVDFEGKKVKAIRPTLFVQPPANKAVAAPSASLDDSMPF